MSETAEIVWESGITVRLVVEEAGGVLLGGFGDRVSPGQHLRLVELSVAGEGRAHLSPGTQHRLYTMSERLVYQGHSEQRSGVVHELRVEQLDPVTGVRVLTTLSAHPGVSVVTISNRVINGGPGSIVLEFVSSLVAGPFLPEGRTLGDDTIRIGLADSSWTAENRWKELSSQAAGIVDVGAIRTAVHDTSQGRFAVTSLGTWSSGDHLPMGYLRHTVSGETWLWEIEHNGSWTWELGDFFHGLYLSAAGPTSQEHGWSIELQPGDDFIAVPVSLAVAGGVREAVVELTAHKRLARRANDDDVTLPVIFNDYMNCLMGDPTTDKLLPLIAAAAEVGAEYFVIDAGWYADDSGWWSDVGAWEPSEVRFPGGLEAVLAEVRARGMVPGLWIEPEVMGVTSSAAIELPDDAYFVRNGRRIVEHGRFHLDFRHPATVARMDAVVDRLVDELGVGYLKFDYNINPGSGTDRDGVSGAQGLLEHNRAFSAWIDGLFARHPALVIENCSAGGMRSDQAQLSRLSIHSTSDQRDHVLYPPIAVNSPMSVPPEQGAVWAYPQPEFSDKDIDLTLSNALLGRIHLSGRIDLLNADQKARVTRAIDVYKSYRAGIAGSTPAWPLGLAGWYDETMVVALERPTEVLFTVWSRSTRPASVTVPFDRLAEADVTASSLYPDDGSGIRWRDGAAHVDMPAGPAARTVRLTIHDKDLAR